MKISFAAVEVRLGRIGSSDVNRARRTAALPDPAVVVRLFVSRFYAFHVLHDDRIVRALRAQLAQIVWYISVGFDLDEKQRKASRSGKTRRTTRSYMLLSVCSHYF